MQQTFLNHAKGRYFWLALLFASICLGVYLYHDPAQTPNGGTWLGYTLGTIGALMILWLLYLGKRKRNFAEGWGTVRGWVSAHVYLGTSLLIVATLHTGFQFGMNIHTLAYVLMCLVIFSGFYGVWAYRTYPAARNGLKRSRTLDDIFVQLEEGDVLIKRQASGLSSDIRGLINSALERTQIGGGIFAQITASDRSMVVIDGAVLKNPDQQPVVDWLVKRLSNATGDESRKLANLVRDYGARQKLLRIIRTDIRMHGLQEIWLLFHVPLSFGLIAVLLAHILSVFIYW